MNASYVGLLELAMADDGLVVVIDGGFEFTMVELGSLVVKGLKTDVFSGSTAYRIRFSGGRSRGSILRDGGLRLSVADVCSGIGLGSAGLLSVELEFVRDS